MAEGLTVDGQVPQCRTCSSLNLNVGVLEEKHDGFEGVAVNFADICSESELYVREFSSSLSHTSLSYFSKCQAGAPLQVHIIRIHQRAQGSQWFSGKEICLASLGFVRS